MMCRTIGAVAVVQVVRKASRISTGQSRKVNCNDKDSLDSWHDLSTMTSCRRLLRIGKSLDETCQLVGLIATRACRGREASRLAPPRTDPYVRLSRIRLLPRVQTASACRMRASAFDTLMRL